MVDVDTLFGLTSSMQPQMQARGMDMHHLVYAEQAGGTS